MNRLKAEPIHEDFKNMRKLVRFPHKEEWDNRLITDADGYQIPSNWSNQELDMLLTQLHYSISTGNMSECWSECEMIIAGSCYLRKPGRSSPDDRLIYATNFGSVPLDWNPNSSRVVDYYRPLSATDRAFGLFICGFLFKILSKPSQNVVQSWSHAKESYSHFYSSRETPKHWPKPQLSWLDCLKNQFCLVKRANQTALRVVNNLEMVYTDVGTVEYALIRYLFVTPLSFTGMHAYKLFCDVKEKTGQETAWLVRQLWCSEFRYELKTIYDISQNWDLGGPNANPVFRYARLLGPQYFPEIQTKSCTNFVYCLARILSRFELPGSNSNPEQIAGLDRINDWMKAKMDGIASNVYMKFASN
ncbi:putative rhabdovirus nucleoprotein [Helianthus annuus]|nr:putative rhabdovirus nucleoprotein [Helianthus annuus]